MREKFVIKLLIFALISVSVFVNTSVFAVERVYIMPLTSHEKAPATNVFQLKGSNDKFILLDDDEDGFFVLSEKYCTLRAFSQNGESAPFNPTDENNIGYWLNNTFLTDKTLTSRLPQIMIDNLVECCYKTEGGGDKVSFSQDYDVNCKVVLLSQTEWSKYNDKFGYADDGSSMFWFLRSARALTGAPLVACLSGVNAGLTADGKWSSVIGIRPAFHLSHDFFNEADINIEKTGDMVISVMRKYTDPNKLKAIYGRDDIITLLSADIAPAVTDVNVIGRAVAGEEVRGSYKFVSLDGQPENGTVIRWLKSRDKENWTTIVGAEGSTYVPSEKDVGYYITMSVTPMTKTAAGATAKAVPLTSPVRAVSKPEASDVRAEGKAEAGYRLEAKYSYSDENRDICCGTEYIWQSSSDMIEISEIGNSRYQKLTGNESGKYVRVGVKPEKRTNSADGRKIVSGDIKYSEWIKVSNLSEITAVIIKKAMNTSITISKTDKGFDISGIIGVAGDVNDSQYYEKLTAEHKALGKDEYSVKYVWQRADSQNGNYQNIKNNTDTLIWQNCGDAWIRVLATAYDKDGNAGKTEYSNPVFVKGRKAEIKLDSSEFAETNVKAGKKYEVWIENISENNSYAYSMSISADVEFIFDSDEYTVGIGADSEKTYVSGVLRGNVYAHEKSFKAGELTADGSGKITVSDVKTTGILNNGTVAAQMPAKIKLIEK